MDDARNQGGGGARFQLFREPVNHLIRLHFARSKETLDEALNRLEKMAAMLES